MDEAVEKITASIDYIGILNALNRLASTGKITAENARNTASRIAEQLGVSVIIV